MIEGTNPYQNGRVFPFFFWGGVYIYIIHDLIQIFRYQDRHHQKCHSHHKKKRRVFSGLTGGRSVVEADLLLLRHMFWDRDPEQGGGCENSPQNSPEKRWNL